MNKIRIPKKFLHGRIKRRGISAGGGGSIIPLDGLALWLKADAITGLADNDPVATWEDSSAANNDATQGTASLRPLYKVNIVNGLPVLRFATGDDGMVTPNSVFGSNPLSFFIVYSGNADAINHRAIQGIDAGHNWLLGPYNSQHRAFNGAFIDGPAVSNGVFVVSTYIHNGTTGSFWVNGSLVGSNANTNTPERICLSASGAFVEELNGDIAEVLGYTNDKTALRTTIEAYLTAKYGL